MEPVENSYPLPNWQSLQRLQIEIKRVLRGSEQRLSVPATVISHGQAREDLDFLMVLSPRPSGVYAFKTGAIWDGAHPQLREPCS